LGGSESAPNKSKEVDVEGASGKFLEGAGAYGDVDTTVRRGGWLTGYWHVITAVIGA